ncbi:MAG TPA: RnfABCDGE type electron transport complex subunit B [Caldimonas sp.]
MSSGTLADALLDALPQTQCTRCGYDDCRAYAEAIAGGEATINRCPPGGREGIERLARVSGRPVVPLEPSCGHEGQRALAVIDEAACIGCALCLKACPVDAIVGAAKRMHTVIDELCTGCELCLPVCPVDCIALVDASGTRTGWDAWSPTQALTAQARYEKHSLRRGSPSPLVAAEETPAPLPKSATIAAALARARAARPRD